ncbi:FMN-linked oxidoreductase [Peniophora sp. CONT]|nr:FMN-linked oxidoreductase [Peniophora sp. CONT]
MSSTKIPTLFTPIKVGHVRLQHRVVLAPTTRFRADDDYVHTDLAVEYYAQRASTPGTLLVTEGTIIAPQAGGGYPNVPGIWNEQQIAAWKKIADVVHAKGSFVFMQLWAIGRTADPAILRKDGPFDVVGPSAIPLDEKHATPRPLDVEEIKQYTEWYVQAARNAIQAGFDGIEIHGANGCLPDQFLQSNSNQRTDEYGGSVENRIRFVSEVVGAITAAIGPERTALRISPWSPFHGMRMSDPIPTFSALVKHLAENHPHLAYLHVIQPRISANDDIEPGNASDSNDFVRAIWSPRPLILAGGFNRETALSEADKGEKNVLVAVGRYFTSNPDLPKRWMHGSQLTPYDRSTFYTPGPKGYTDWAFSEGVEQ